MKVGRRTVDFSGDTVVEAGTEGDDNVGTLHSEVGGRAAVHAEHLETERVELVERAETLESGRDGDVAVVRELAQEIGALRRGEHALAGVDDRLLRVRDQRRGLLEDGVADRADVPGVGLRRRRVSTATRGQVRLGELGVGPAVRDRVAQDTRGHVLRQVDEHRARTARGGNLERLVHPPRELGNVQIGRASCRERVS